jgi:hypothetical protein
MQHGKNAEGQTVIGLLQIGNLMMPLDIVV